MAGLSVTIRCVFVACRSSGGPAGGLPLRALGSVGGAALVRPVLADGRMRVRHGHAEEHLAVLQLLRYLQNDVHAAYNCGHVSTDF